jgi:Mlc titration factor MtfA (ptsG expression regulator)
MLFSWLRARRRRKLLSEPFPVRWTVILERNVGHYSLLSGPEQAQLRDICRILIAEKRWLGRGGLFISEEMMVTIAAQAGLLLLGGDRDFFPHVRDIVVFPTTFRTPVAEDDWEDDELCDTILAGQAVDRGPVLLAWDQVLPEGRDPKSGHNVVIHEFAHQLDFTDRLAGGTPILADRSLKARWRYVMTTAFEDHRRGIREKRDMFFTPHAAENEAEFFAEATEAFICGPIDFEALHPDLYQLLGSYYRLDPRKWWKKTV